MRMMNELSHLFLYSANKKVYAPIDENDKKKNSAILLLTPNLEISNRLMTLPYIYNPNLFTSFYINRDVSAYIDKIGIENIDFDEKREEAVSEAMIHAQVGNVKFKFDDHTSMMDERYIRDVYNKNTVKVYTKKLNIDKVPDKINVVVHPNTTDLRKNAPKYIKIMGDDYYSYCDKDTIHVLSKLVYDPQSMRGDYNTYLLIELLYMIIKSYNNNLPFVGAMGVAMNIAGLELYKKKEKNNTIDGGDALKFANTIDSIIERYGYNVLYKYLRTADINVFSAHMFKGAMNRLNKVLFEATLSYSERQRLLPSDFGVPDKRKYPIHDEDHVRAAIKLFNNCDPVDEEELAQAIIKRMKRFGITNVKVSPDNRFSKYYYPEGKKKAIREGYMSLNSSSGYNSDYLSPDNTHPEFKNKLIGVEFGKEYAGEVFTDKNGNLVAYYNTKKDDNDKVWITALKCMPGFEDAYSFLIGRAMDYQNAMYASIDINDNEMIKRYEKFGFNYYGDKDGNRLMTVNESYETDFNWNQIESICNHLDDDELRRITFHDKYEDSKFVIKRLIARVGNTNAEEGQSAFIPAGFLDVYQFPSNPSIAQIVIAVDKRFRGIGVANSLVKELLKSDLYKTFGFKIYYWTAHTDNYASQYLALKNGFIDTNTIDRYGRKVFINKIIEDESANKKPIISLTREGYESDDISLITENTAFFFEADNPKYSGKLRQYLYAERMKNDKDVLLIYDSVKAMNPNIRRTYLKIEMYKKQNLFVDLSYYHSLFLKNNSYKLDNAVNFYFDFINKLINNKAIDKEYSKKTIFIPVDTDVWSIAPDSDITDYRKNLNPISLIFRLIRTNPGALRRAWGNKSIVFTGSRGYFTIDFNKFELKDLSRLRTNLTKLMSNTEPIKDEFEADNVIADDTKDSERNKARNSDTPKAMAAKIIDRIEGDSNIKLNNISAIGSKQSNQPNDDFITAPHLTIVSDLEINRKTIAPTNGIVIISIDPDGPNGFTRFNRTALSGIGNAIDTYCIPN